MCWQFTRPGKQQTLTPPWTPRSSRSLKGWWLHLVLPEFLYDVSSRAQRVGKACGRDLEEANEVLREMKAAASQGQAKPQVAGIGNHPALVTYFDASLGKSDGVAKRGEAHFVGHPNMFAGPAVANLIEFQTRSRGWFVQAWQPSVQAWPLQVTDCCTT